VMYYTMVRNYDPEIRYVSQNYLSAVIGLVQCQPAHLRAASGNTISCRGVCVPGVIHELHRHAPTPANKLFTEISYVQHVLLSSCQTQIPGITARAGQMLQCKPVGPQSYRFRMTQGVQFIA
jgi:hypothetical protein